MDIASLASQLNSHDIKELNKYHILSIFSKNNWILNEKEIESVPLTRYLGVNTDFIINKTTERVWLFFTDVEYNINDDGHTEWEDLLDKVEETENLIETALEDVSTNPKQLIELTIKLHWKSVVLFVLARDIVKGGFNISDIGTFYTTMRIADKYTTRARRLANNQKFKNRDMVRYYDDNEDDFWCDFLILDLIIDEQLDFNLIEGTGMFDGYSHDDTQEVIQEVNQAELYEKFREQQHEPDYKLDDITNHEFDTEVEVDVQGTETYNESSISGGMNAAYEPTETIHLSRTSESVNIDVSFSEPESVVREYVAPEPERYSAPEPTRSYDSSPSYDSGSSDSIN